MLVAVFGDAHAHADALEAVVRAAERRRRGAVVAGRHDRRRPGSGARRAADARALLAWRCVGNHDYGATGSVDCRGSASRPRGAALDRAGVRRLSDDDIAWLRSRKPAARRDGVQCWHGGPRNPVWQFVGPSNAAGCLAMQRAPLGLVAHTHLADAWRAYREAACGA